MEFKLITDRFGNVIKIIPISGGGCGGLLIAGVLATAFLGIIGVFLEKYMIMAATNKGEITIAFLVATLIVGVLYHLTEKEAFLLLHMFTVSPLLVFAYYSLLIPVFDDVAYLFYVFLSPVISFAVGLLFTIILQVVSSPKVFGAKSK